MNKIEITSVAVRLFAIFILVWLLRQLPLFFVYDLQGANLLLAVSAIGVTIIVALLFWVFSGAIAQLLLAARQAPAGPTAWSAEDLWSVGAIFLGLYTLAEAGPRVVYWLVYAVAKSQEAVVMPLAAEQRASIAMLAGQLGIGLWLLLGSRGLARGLAALRGRETG